jgi:PilZ domain
MDSSDERQRREGRYPLNLSVRVIVPECPLIWAQSQNISSRGILLTTDTPIQNHSRVDLSVYLPLQAGIGLSNVGEVVRVEQRKSGGFAIAVSCEQHFRLSPVDKRA